MSGRKPQCTVFYLQAGFWGSVHIVYVGMWCEERLRMQRWSLREKAIIIIFLYRAVVGIICTGCIGSLELGGCFKIRLGFGACLL